MAERLSYLTKNALGLASGVGDLIDDLDRGRVALADLSPEQLPAEMQTLPEAEMGAYLRDRIAARRKIQVRIDGIVEKREAHLAGERARRSAAGDADGFADRVIETVRSQAAAKGIAFD